MFVCVCVSIQLLLFCYFTYEYLIGLTFFLNTSQFKGDFITCSGAVGDPGNLL